MNVKHSIQLDVWFRCSCGQAHLAPCCRYRYNHSLEKNTLLKLCYFNLFKLIMFGEIYIFIYVLMWWDWENEMELLSYVF